MNLIISGYGKMGMLLEARALTQRHKITAIVDPRFPGKPGLGAPIYESLSKVMLDSRPVVIDFSTPSAAFNNIAQAVERQLPIVVGTTGWYDRLDEVRTLVTRHNGAVLYAPNFSLGINLFSKIISYAAALINQFEEYDVGGLEAHHNHKADSPSGTAKVLAEEVLRAMPRKKHVVYDKLDRPPEKDELHIASVRVGSVPGTHTIYFDSADDTIEIAHIARSRDALAAGALTAAVWLEQANRAGKRGIFTLEDVVSC
ncbi:MAG: 4-hydroxy-tetrahydrodipicolinate reductase [Spirochaetaceae bacterium]|jgi:4-hydroxy-tetrahydrodipicolinate reductase|nr:4-hydroxy-tetrahydrodipicolinate reductase [Spirochaetaceae bacterium]